MKLPALASTLAAATLLAACGPASNSTQETAPPTAVRVAAVLKVPLTTTVRAVGVLTPKNEARLSFKAGGVLEAVRVEEGQRIKKGQLLASLRQTEINSAVEQAQQNAAKAKRDLDRAKALFADGVATEEQVQDLTTAYRVAQAALRSTEFNARFARIEAPDDGVVLRKLAQENELVQAGQPILIVGGNDRGWIIRTAVADRDIVHVHIGDPATVSFDAFPGQTYPARVSVIASAADAMTGTFEIELQVDPAGARFAQGLVAKVALPRDAGRTAPVTVVPVQALLEANDGGAFVFVIEPGKNVARRVRITTGRIVEDRVEVTGGLAPGQLIVTDGAAYLEDGATVRVATDT
jgi:RND family efflux transporter MFP subunit